MRERLAIFPLVGLIWACAAERPSDSQRPDLPAARSERLQSTILSRSDPADGSVVSRAPENLVLEFSRPARLNELMVAGTDGTLMPVMVTAPEEATRFSVPLPDLEAGTYEIKWRATSGGQGHQGSIRFQVR